MGGGERPMDTKDTELSRVNKLNSSQVYKSSSKKASEPLIKTVLDLHRAGFNVVPVFNKKPLTSWSSEKRLSEEELNNILSNKNFNGVALVAGSENPLKPNMHLIIVDIDNPNVLENQDLRQIIEKTARWWTGPRCPQCGSKDSEKIGEELHCKSCGATYRLSEAKRGLGAVFWIDKNDVEKLKGTIRGKDVEILVRNYALIPPSLHPSGILYEWIKEIDLNDREKFGIHKLSQQELETILKVIGAKRGAVEKEKEGKVEKGCKEFDDKIVDEIVNLLRKAYKQGQRDKIVFYLTGWFRKANVCYESARMVVEILAMDDEEKDQRLYVVDRTYGLRGNPPSPEEMKGVSGLQELLEEALGDEEAVSIIARLEEILGMPSPYKDSVYAVLDYEKQLFAIANVRKKIIVRARRVEKTFVYKELVVNAVPVKIIIYDSPIGGIRKFEMVFESEIRSEPLVIGPATIEEIIARLKAEGLVQHSRLVEDVLNALIKAYIKRGLCEFRKEIEAPGFFNIDGRITVVKYDTRYSFEELHEAINVLEALAVWFSHVKDRFATVIRWGAVAPFSYIYKQSGRWMPWLYLTGSSRTGKTTLGEIVLAMWGLDSVHIKTGASMDTIARLGHVLSQSTFPTLVNEPGGALSKDEIVEALKNAIEKNIVRGKFVKGTYTEIPALSPLIFTSNKVLPNDDALLRRLVVLQFTFSERIPEERAKKFESSVKPQLVKLSAIGKCIAEKVVSGKYVLTGDWSKDSVALLSMCYEEAGIAPPDWIKMQAESLTTLEDLYENMVESVRSCLVEFLEHEYSMYVGRVPVPRTEKDGIDYMFREYVDPKERVMILLERRRIPWLILRENEGRKEVVITSGILDVLRERIGDITLKNLAELLGWEYKVTKIGNKPTRAIVVSLEAFLSFLYPK